MRYLDVPDLQVITEHITNLSGNGLTINTRLELYSVRTTISDDDFLASAETHLEIARSYNSSSHTSSSYGSYGATAVAAFTEAKLENAQNKRIYMYLLQILNHAYPRFDFSTICPSKFYELPYDAAKNVINSTLSSCLSDFNQIRHYLWLAISDIAPGEHSTVFSVDCSPYAPFEEEDGVWSQNFMFYNNSQHQVLLFTLKASPSDNPYQCTESQEDQLFYGDNGYGNGEMPGSDYDESAPHELSQSEYDGLVSQTKFFDI